MLLGSNSNAQSQLMYYWSFNNWTPTVTAATPGLTIYASVTPDYAGAGLDTVHAKFVNRTIPGTSSAYATYCDNTTGDTTNARMGAVAGNCLKARNPNDSMELLIYAPTKGYKTLTLKYACQLSSYTSGDSVNVFSYSTDSGSTWKTSGTGLSKWVDSGSLTFKLISVNITDTNAFNNSGFVFRINLVGRNSGTAGNNRFDNVTLEGDTISGAVSHVGIGQVVAPEVNYTVRPNPASTQITITSDLAGEKSVIITNLVGQHVCSGNASGQDFPVNISSLNPGVYFITIKEIETGSSKTLQFIKQ